MHWHTLDFLDVPLVEEDADARRDGPVASQVVDDLADGVPRSDHVVDGVAGGNGPLLVYRSDQLLK
jgi:hypothetical protein